MRGAAERRRWRRRRIRAELPSTVATTSTATLNITIRNAEIRPPRHHLMPVAGGVRGSGPRGSRVPRGLGGFEPFGHAAKHK